MKHLFSSSRAFASLRIVVAGACVLTAAALAFVATANNNSPSSVSVSKKARHTDQDIINWANEDYTMTPPTSVDPDAEVAGGNPNRAAEEEREHRAYPADELDLGGLINGLQGYANFMANPTPAPSSTPVVTPTPPDSTPTPTATATATPKKGGKKGGGKKGKPTPTPSPATVTIDAPISSPPEPPPINFWQEVGGGTSHTATDPNVLTFTGSTQIVSGRITALALDTFNGCSAGFCRVWVAAAGGGIWRTTNALAGTPTWTFISGGPGGFVTNAIGTITYFNDGSVNGQLFVGTGEPNTSADSEAGVGIYKSLDGGNTWTLLPATIGPITTSGAQGNNGTYTGNAFLGRSISSIAVTAGGNTLYVSSDRGVRGISSVLSGGATANPTTPRPPYGVFKSTNGGQTFSFIFDGDPNCGPGTCLGAGAFSSTRGFHELRLDPNNPSIIYAADYPNGTFGVGGGIWRSTNAGTSFVQIKTARNSLNNVDRCAFDVVGIAGPATRMVAGCGNSATGIGGTSSYGSGNQARIYDSENADTAAAFTDLTALEAPQLQSLNYCTGQCWYDNFVVFAAGSPTDVYVGGSFKYNEYGHATDGRGVIENRFAGAIFGGCGTFFSMICGWNDFTWDAQNNGPAGSQPPFGGGCCQPNAITPNGIHPDQHALLTVPGSPLLFFEGSDGGLVRSSGAIVDISGAQCPGRTYPGPQFAAQGTITDCLLALGSGDGGGYGVPTLITGLNTGLGTLQFQSVSVASTNVNLIQGGTQDNGTWQDLNGSTSWNQEIYGDGGQSGFQTGNSAVRFNTFTGPFHDANFASGNPTTWRFMSWNQFISGEGAFFYDPIIADPTGAAAGTIFNGLQSVWRTQAWGGPLPFVPCDEFTGSGVGCGDFVVIGNGVPSTDLTSAAWGGRAGSLVAALARTTSNTGTLWAATGNGRIFITENAAAGAGAVVWNRIDAGGAAGDPGRFITGIAINPANTREAFVTYSGYNFNTPAQKGHVFRVDWSGAGAATFTDLSSNIWDIPITAVAFDSVTGDLYAGSDFVVFRLDASPFTNPAGQWFIAGLSMPMVETAGLTIIPGSRVLYAATHGRGIWRLVLP